MTRKRSSRSVLPVKPLKPKKSMSPFVEMRKCLGQLKRMVPTVESNQKINQLELLQHVINYIQDLEVTLDSPSSILTAVSTCTENSDRGTSHQYVITADQTWFVCDLALT
ncbi:DNA-binding protein inhibitor ID-2-A [Fasciola gigantica]|uniref:DNA-binding protein inhibitor ID-2-A n=1 Tax=Fasciola gigantica TaxID=46835 RepID=A0A504YQU2_FASGI|nr:DNA-binding protein inhibitor ID-2-A [Fasciola gigantica]